MAGSDGWTLRRKERATRIALAIERKGWSKWRFQKELEALGLPGASRANVDRYLSGEVAKPPIEFFIATARLTEVSLLWLLGESDASSLEEVAAEDAKRAARVKVFRQDFEREVSKGFPLLKRYMDSLWGPVWSAFGAFHSSLMNTEDPPADALAGAREIGSALRAPLRELGVEETELNEWQLAGYVSSVCEAIGYLNLEYGKLHPPVTR